jgi:hypothetical protein
MTNSLIKNVTTVAALGTEEVPATPYVPAVPSRTVYERRLVCGFRYSGPGHYVFNTNPQTGQTTMIWVSDAAPGPGQYTVSTGVWACTYETVPVTYPGTPAVPAQPGYTRTSMVNTIDYQLGWNAGGRSIAFFTADGNVKFNARESIVGAIVGLNVDDGTPVDYNGNTINYGFLLAHGVAHIIQNGAIIGAAVGTYTAATLFEIYRAGTTITYKMGGTTVGTATGAPTTATWLEAALFSGDDEIFNPTLTQTSAPDTTAQTGTIDASLPPLTMFASPAGYAEINATLPNLALDADAGLMTPAYAVLSAELAPLASSINWLTGEIGSIDASLPSMEMLAADHPYGEIKASLPSLLGGMLAMEGDNNASMVSQGVADAMMAPVTFLVVTMSSAGVLTAAETVDIVIPAELRSQALLSSIWGTSAILDAVIASLAISGSVLGVPESDSETWVMNLGTQGTTNYTNYGFNSFALIGQRYYGAGPAGIFVLDGDTDAGELIRAKVSLGKLDFGTALQKTISHAYIGMSAKGNLFMKVIVGEGDEAREYVYKTRGFSSSLQQQRIVCGKGLKANYAEVELYNEDGADFEIDTVEFHVADLKRRI